jgi:hypothetical protein
VDGKRAYTGAMRTAKKIDSFAPARFGLSACPSMSLAAPRLHSQAGWSGGLKFATKFLPLLSRKACYRVALLLASLAAIFDRRGRRITLSNLCVAFGDHISSERRAQIARESGDRHLLHGRVSQKHAFDFDGKNIFTAIYDDVFRAVEN